MHFRYAFIKELSASQSMKGWLLPQDPAFGDGNRLPLVFHKGSEGACTQA